MASLDVFPDEFVDNPDGGANVVGATTAAGWWQWISGGGFVSR